jgi:hypothetical protein
MQSATENLTLSLPQKGVKQHPVCLRKLYKFSTIPILAKTSEKVQNGIN